MDALEVVRRRGMGDPEATFDIEAPEGYPAGGEPVGGPSAGPAKVSSFVGGTSSLLKRSPIPASPERCQNGPFETLFSEGAPVLREPA